MQFMAANPTDKAAPPTFCSFLAVYFFSFCKIRSKKASDNVLVADEYKMSNLGDSPSSTIEPHVSQKHQSSYIRFSSSLQHLSVFTRDVSRIPVTQVAALRDFEQMYRKGLDDMKLSMDFEFDVRFN